MDKSIKRTVIYYSIALLFSWTFWIIAMVASIKGNIAIPYNEGIYSIFSNGYESSEQKNIHFIFSLAVYGPLIGAIIVKLLFKDSSNSINVRNTMNKKWGVNGKWLLFVFVYPILLFSAGVLVSFISTGFSKGFSVLGIPFWFLPILFVYQCFTSGTEEFGWRGALQPILQSRYTAEKACYIVGILWSVWHYPFIIFTNYKSGILLTALSIVGFTMLTIPQAFVMGWVYNSTKSIFLSVIFHAWLNTISFYIFAASPNPQVTSIFVAVGTWLAANYLIKRFGKKRLS
ncbi:MAG: CPBP family intramembrane glutamic endopeptidase [Clostridiaceae bacterium]